MRYLCTLQRRLKAVKLAGLLNGIEYVEVRDTDESVQPLRQRTLYVHLLKPPPVDTTTGAVLGMAVVIDGGQRIATVASEWIARADRLPSLLTAAEQAALVTGLDDPDHVLVVRTASRGDFSRYTLHLVAALGGFAPPAAFDLLLVELAFSFKVECPSDFDCGPECTCLPRRHASPTIDYLAKDYQGFRRIMLERMALLAPEWTERNPADVGVALVEMLAYVADELSYRQDAVTTEAYLDTARSRISLRRLARLVDYRVHEGCNARAWVRIQVSSPAVTLAAGTVLLTQVADLPTRLAVGSRDHEAALDARPVVFSTVDPTVLHSNLNSLAFYTWGELGCCLPIGAASATLRGRHPDLRVGDVLVLAEVRSPTSMRTDELDPSHRQAVRLVEVTNATDPSGAVVPGGMQNVTEIRWHDDDALTFPLCINVVDGDDDVAQAYGNIVLVDHGELIADEDLGSVPESRLDRVPAGGCDDPDDRVAVPPRYRPLLSRGPLTRAVAQPRVALFDVPLTPALKARLDARQYADPLPALFSGHGIALPSSGPTVRGEDPLWSVGDAAHAYQLRNDLGKLGVFDVSADPAIDDLAGSPHTALPAISLRRDLHGVPDDWAPQFDLLGSDRGATEFTVETETDGTVQLRFGDDVHGLRPEPTSRFEASYRIGNGVAGNVGREAIVHIVSNDSAIEAVTNPIPAAGGVDPETADQVRRDAPFAFAVQERAVTEPDYAEVTERNGSVQRAAATFRWTGSWHTAFVTADRFGGLAVDAPFERRIRGWLERYRMAGYDLEVDGPVFVPLEVALHVCVEAGYFRADVAEEVRDVLSDRVLTDGRRGLFHPDNLTFGQSVYISAVHAAVHSIEGVQSVEVLTFERLREPESSGIDSGVLPMGRLEIGRLDDDRNFPERGILKLTFGGGA